jgi:sugar phosphate isomerase/epimerase
MGNAAAAGIDPLVYLRKYPHRFELVHIKEWAAPFTPTFTTDFPKYMPFGKGTTDWGKMIATLRAYGIHEMIIEQDGTPTGNELAAVSQAYQYLKTKA